MESQPHGRRFIMGGKSNSGMRKLSAVIVREEGMYVASCPEVGTVSQGRTLGQALKNLKEATELYLEECPSRLRSKPIMATFEVASHASPA